MNWDPDDITLLHALYCKTTGFTPNLRVNERLYASFLEAGFTSDDLGCVLRYLVSENRRMSGAKFSLRLDKLMDYEFVHFDSLLQEARQRERNRPKSKTESEKVIELFRKTPTPEVDHAPKIVGDVLRKLGEQ